MISYIRCWFKKRKQWKKESYDRISRVCANLRRQGYSLAEISVITNVPRDSVECRIKQGMKILQEEPFN